MPATDTELHSGIPSFISFSWLFLFVVFLAGSWPNGICFAEDEPRVIRAGSELDFRPYSYTDKDDRPTGFGVELLKAVGEKMGLRIRITPGPWDQVWNGLVAGELDVLPVVARTPGREALVDFTLPHTETFDAFFVREGRPAFPDLAAAAGREIIVLRSDAPHHVLLERKFTGKVIPVESIPEGLRLIAAGRHDAMLCSKLVGVLELEQADIEGVRAGPPIPDYKRVFSFAVRKGDAELREKLNQGLRIVKASGEYERIYNRWLAAGEPWRKWLPYFESILILLVVLGALVATLQWLVRKRTRELASAKHTLQELNATLEQRVAERTAALREREELLRHSQEMARLGSWELNHLQNRLTWSDEVYRILGLQPQETEASRGAFLERVHPDDRRKSEDAYSGSMLSNRDSYEVEYRVVRKDTGEIRRVYEKCGHLRDAAGTIVRSVCMVHDITDRKRAEDMVLSRLRLSESALNSRMGNLIQSSLDEVERLTGSAIGFFHFVNETQNVLTRQVWSTNTLRNECRAGEKVLHDSIGRAGVWADCFQSRAPVIHNDYPGLPHKKGLPVGHPPVLRQMALPIFREDSIIAIIGVGNKATDYIQSDVDLLQEFASVVMQLVAGKKAEEEQVTTVEFLRLVNEKRGTWDMIPEAITFFRRLSGCDAVGVRLREGDDFPYFESRGFPEEFILAENPLCARDKDGEVVRESTGDTVLECMCGNVIRGRTDPAKPFFTANGSFWTNSTSDLLARTTEADRQGHTRNRCCAQGYESVALIPLQAGQDCFGLVQLNGRKKGMFSAEAVAMWERLAGYLSIALAKARAEEALRSSLADKDILMRELAHRTKNNMQVIGSLLGLQAAASTDSAFARAVSEAQDRIRAMALVHENLYQSNNIASLNMKDYVEDLMGSLIRAHKGSGEAIRPNLDTENLFLTIDAALPCGLIINELVSNSLKHAFPGGKYGNIFLSFRSVGGKVELRYRDDGKGLPRDIDLSRIQSLGLKLVYNLSVRQLRGTMEVRHDPLSEFVFTFEGLAHKETT